MTINSSEAAVLRKYDVPVPRYTTYPTLPYRQTEKFSSKRWIECVAGGIKNNTTRADVFSKSIS
jgi:oxygen-independent coproporphyrinogen-3 oxidase